MRKKGFTLIELLAVIVVLAIIALIATPIVMNIIGGVQESAAKRSAERYLDAVELAIMTEELDHRVEDGLYMIQEDGSLCLEGQDCSNEATLEVPVKGNLPVSGGKIAIQNGRIVDKLTTDTSKKTNLTIDKYAVTLDENNKIVVEEIKKIVKDMAYYGLTAHIYDNMRATFAMSYSKAQNVPTGFFKSDGDFAYINYNTSATMTFDEFKTKYNDYLMEVAKFIFDKYDLSEEDNGYYGTDYNPTEEYFYLEGATNATAAEGILFKKHKSGVIEIVGSYCNV